VVLDLPAELGGQGELLVIEREGVHVLPAGPLQPGERLLQAAERILREQAGVIGEALRLLYIVEDRSIEVLVAVHCSLTTSGLDDISLPEDAEATFAPLPAANHDFQPMALVEVLREDLVGGFVRPIGHVLVERDGSGRIIQVRPSW
jgi:ADP-ribose pyrophosphatase YjhB (NUDIX family)